MCYRCILKKIRVLSTHQKTIYIYIHHLNIVVANYVNDMYHKYQYF